MDQYTIIANSREMELKEDQIILGREEEIGDIIKNFDKVLEGEFAVCVLSGEAGVGKTYLVSHVAKRLLNVNATYIHGKYKHYKSSLFSAFNEVFIGIIEQTLTFSDEKMNAVKKLLKAKLGVDSNLIIAICPEAEKLLGYYRKVDEEDYHKLEYRFHNAICIFLDILSQELYPLIIHIDDLQWADEGSIRMINFLCSKRSSLNFYLVLSLRDEIKDNQREMGLLKSLAGFEKSNLMIKLRRLNLNGTKEFLNYLLCNQVYEIEQVSQLFFKATLGTPFYISQLMETVFKDEKIQFDKKMSKWVFDIPFLDKLQLPEDIKYILVNHMKALSTYDYELFQLLACLGGQVDRKLLGKIITNEHEKTIERLERLCETGLIISDKNEKDEQYTKYLFSHDIIFEIVHKSMSEEVREENHYIIANKLIDDTDKIYIDEHRIFIATQLLDCKNYIQKELDSTRYILELYYAGIKAKQITLIEEAVKFFELCLLLMPSADLSISSALGMKVKLELAECLFICSNKKEAENEFEKLIREYTNQQDLVLIKSRCILLYTYSGNYNKVLSLSLEVLEHLDFKIRTDYIRLRLVKEIIECKLRFTNKKIGKLKYIPKVNDPRILNIETTLIRMAAVANLVDEELFAMLIIKLSNLLARYGNSELSAPAYATCSYIFYHLLKDEKKAFKLADNAEIFLEHVDNTKCMTYFIIGTFIEHWKSSGEESIKNLMRSIEVGVKEGEFQYAGYAFTAMVEMRYMMGTTIDDLKENFKLLDQYDDRLKHDITQSTLFILQNHLDQLTGEIPVDLDENRIIGLDKSQKLTYYFFKLQRLYLDGRIEECYKLLDKIVPISGMIKGFMTQVDLAFYITMVRLDSHRSLKGISKLKNKRNIDKALKQFGQWIKLYRDNHFARYMYIKAKYLEIFSNSLNVGVLYEEGIAFAKERKQFQIVALGELLAGNYYENNKKIASVYRQEAVGTLEKWGAKHYAMLVREKYIIKPQEANIKKVTSEVSDIKNTQKQNKSRHDHVYKMSYHMKQVENMDKDNTFLYSLDSLVKESLADYGAIYLENNDQIYMAYELIEGNTIKHHELIPMEKATLIPHKVMRYVVRTGSEIVLNQKPMSGLFANDIYFNNKDDMSLLCIPLKYMDVFVGIVYIEWNENERNGEFIIDAIKGYMPLLIAKTIAEDKKNYEGKKRIKQDELPLTKRELEVFKLIIKGLTNKQIGEQLNISLSTVKTHVINIYSKLDIKNRVAAVEKAKIFGFID